MLPIALVVTSTASSHDAPALIVPPDMPTLPAPATAEMVPVHVPMVDMRVALGGDFTTKPKGNVSVNATPVSAIEPTAVLVMKIFSRVVPLGGMLVGVKLLFRRSPSMT